MPRKKILGAGPAGLTAAITLARADYEVDVYEIRKDSGAKFCGDLHGVENWTLKKDFCVELADVGLQINFDCDPFDQVTITNGKENVDLKFAAPMFYLVKRGTFPGTLDQGLKAQALEAGVRLHFGQSPAPEEVDLVATGPIKKEIFALEKGIIFKTDLPDTCIGLVNDHAALRGYAYLLVTKGYGCICTVLFDHFKSVSQCFDETMEIIEKQVDLKIRDVVHAGGTGSFSTHNSYTEGGRLYAGEAAGVQDLLWGFGVRNVITSGYLAARSIIEGADYAELSRRTFAGKLQASVVNRYLWEKLAFSNYTPLLKLLRLSQRCQGLMRHDLHDIMRFIHRYGPIHRVFMPLALARIRRRYPQLRI
jgi:flavin-dependent dehydrogenase